MIEKRTVFILGAGASCPYGFPTARGLRKEILTKFEDRYLHFLGGAGEKIGAVRTVNGYPSLRTAKQFLECFDLSGTESVDLFLSRNPRFEKIGKMAICLSILHAEMKSKFRERVEKPEHDWYFYLYNRLMREATHPDDYSQFGDNPISFVTFNYDRSLEYYLLNCLRHSFEGMDEQRAIDELGRRPTIHVYGKPALPKSAESGEAPILQYGKEIAEKLPSIDLLGVTDSIHALHEERSNPQSKWIHEEISQAERLFFLGFGYAKENLAALGLPDVLRADQLIYGTALACTKREIRDIETLLKLALEHVDNRPSNRADQVKIIDCDCVSLLREFL